MRGDILSGARYAPIGVLAVLAALVWYSLGMPGRSHDGPLPQISSEEKALAARLTQHVVAVASAPHNTGTSPISKNLRVTSTRR